MIAHVMKAEIHDVRFVIVGKLAWREMVAHQHHAAARRHVLDSVGAHLEVVAVQKRDDSEGLRQVPLRNAVVVHAARIERQFQSIDPRRDVVGHRPDST